MSQQHRRGSIDLDKAHHTIYSKVALPPIWTDRVNGLGSASVPDKVMTRLAILRSGPASQHIECDLMVVELSDHQYQALSYVWGDEADLELITCCGQPLKIRRNLFMALNQLRKSSADRLLWIDAICIDQKNLRERGEQVSLMGRIYGAAERVVVWLGEPRNEDASAFDTIMELSRSIPERKQKMCSRSKSRTVSQAEIDSYTRLSRLQYRQLLVFLSRPWFERVWIIQEVVRSKQAVILYGRDELQWDKFVKVVLSCSDALSYLVAKYPHESLEQVNAFDNLAAIDSLKRDNEKMTLFAILCIASTFKSTDERDKLFALLNLGNRSSLRIQPDYTSSYFDVFKQHVVYELTKRHRLDYLARPPVTHMEQEWWPSWVPDWTEKSRSSYFYTAMTHGFRASADAMPVLSVRGDVLRVKGRIVDRIADVIEPMDRSQVHQNAGAEGVDSGQIIQWLEKCLALVPLKLNLLPDAAESALEPLLKTFACVGVHGRTERSAWSMKQRDNTTDLKRSLNKLAVTMTSLGSAEDGRDTLLKAVTRLASQLYPAITDRQFLRTVGLKRYGWVSKRAERGDAVCVLYGGKVPFVLRQTRNGLWRIIGECYVDGLMEGQAVDMEIGSIVDFHVC